MAGGSGRPFIELLRKGGWHSGGRETPCGAGATLAYTAAIRADLPRLFKEYGIGSVVDAGCGDFNWLSAVDLSGIDYLGLDVVPELIAGNTRKYAVPNIRFAVRDIAAKALPPCDLTLCRFVLIHLPTAQALRFLRNIQSKYLLAGTYPDAFNAPAPRDWEGWAAARNFRPVNLEKPPFDLPEPLERLPDWVPGYPCHHLGLWRLNR